MNTIQAQIKEYLEERGWDNLPPADLVKSIMIEGAELLENFQWKNYTAEEIKANPELLANIQKEMADVMIYAIELAIHLDIDMNQAVQQKMEHNAKKYPAAQIKNADSLDDFYMSQKKKYRREGTS